MDTFNGEKPDKLATASLVCAIMACCFNMLIITSFLGFPFGVLALIFAIISYRRHRFARAGFVLSLISFFIIAVYLLTVVTGLLVDPMI